MKVGDYCRTKDGFIAKLIEKDTWYKFDGVILENEYTYNYLSKELAKELIIKSSPNIIDLIEVGDYVNGLMVNEISEHTIFLDDMRDFSKKDINYVETIVTKEQFESMEYRVGE